MLLALLTAPSLRVFSQTSNSNTAVSVDETIAFLLAQNNEAKAIIIAQEKRITDLETEAAVERENSASISKSYESAKTEIASLKSSNEALARAVALHENTIALLQTDNAKQKDKAKKATREKYKAYAVAGVVVVLKFLIP